MDWIANMMDYLTGALGSALILEFPGTSIAHRHTKRWERSSVRAAVPSTIRRGPMPFLRWVEWQDSFRRFNAAIVVILVPSERMNEPAVTFSREATVLPPPPLHGAILHETAAAQERAGSGKRAGHCHPPVVRVYPNRATPDETPIIGI